MLPTEPSLITRSKGMPQYNKHRVHTTSSLSEKSDSFQNCLGLYRPTFPLYFISYQIMTGHSPPSFFVHFVLPDHVRVFFPLFLYLFCMKPGQGIFLSLLILYEVQTGYFANCERNTSSNTCSIYFRATQHW